MEQVNINEIIANPGAERMILANCLNDPNTIIECESEGLSPKHFAIDGNRIIYSAIIYLFTKNAKIDAISIINAIKDEKAQKTLDDLGGLEYIMLLQQSPTSPNIKMFCQDIIAFYTRRQIYSTCNNIQSDMLKVVTNDTEQILGNVNQQITNIVLDSSKVSDAYKMGDKLGERLQKLAENPIEVPGLPTGWHQFDKITKGLEAGDLAIIVAESKVGKSVTMLNWGKHIAIDMKLPILLIDSEQSEKEQEMRLLASVSQVPEDEIKTGLFMEDTAYGLAKDKIAKLQKGANLIKQSQFYHVFMPDFTLEKIQAVTRKFHLKYGIVALFFDYVAFNPLLLSQNRQLRDDLILTNLVTGLKDLGGILKIPIITAAQENRSQWGNTEKDAKSIGGSIGILQKATKLCFLRNKTEEELALGGANKGNQVFIVAYQRHGACPVNINIHYDKIRLTQREA